MKNYIHHITLTVSNAKASAEFYKDVLGWIIKEQKDDYAYLIPDNNSATKFLLVLSEAREKIEDTGFNRNRIGLDHFALSIETIEELKEIEERLKTLNIQMEDGGITDDGFSGTAIFCSDPDGMMVEWHLEK